jgi:translation elongation factor EF-Tu-like GTPase
MFQKELDGGTAGDNLGILLKASIRKRSKRDGVAKPSYNTSCAPNCQGYVLQRKKVEDTPFLQQLQSQFISGLPT